MPPGHLWHLPPWHPWDIIPWHMPGSQALERCHQGLLRTIMKPWEMPPGHFETPLHSSGDATGPFWDLPHPHTCTQICQHAHIQTILTGKKEQWEKRHYLFGTIPHQHKTGFHQLHSYYETSPTPLIPYLDSETGGKLFKKKKKTQHTLRGKKKRIIPAKHTQWLIRNILKNWCRADNLHLPAAHTTPSHFKVELPGISI